MAHLLMIESWVGASGNLLPPLLKSLGHTYTFVTRRPEHYQNTLSQEQHAVFRYAENVLVTETNDIQGLIEYVKPYPFDGVITVCDYYIETVKEVAEALGLPCPFPQSVGTVRMKHRLRQALDKAGISNPRYGLAKDWPEVKQTAEAIGYPLVLKPVDLASSAFVKLIKDESQLLEAYQTLEGFPLNFRDQERDRTYLLEEYMTGTEVSVESISYGDELTIVGITDKSVTGAPYFIENGHMFPAKLDEDTRLEVERYVRQALKAVGYDHGIAHTEVMITADGPRIVEINPRTAGNYIVELIQRVTGMDMLKAFAELSIGQRPSESAAPTGVSSAAIQLLVPPHGGIVTEVLGTDSLQAEPHVVRVKLESFVGKELESPIDNACYLGHVVTEDPVGYNARAYAEAALNRIILRYAPEGVQV